VIAGFRGSLSDQFVRQRVVEVGGSHSVISRGWPEHKD
jgi:hypothetical protein